MLVDGGQQPLSLMVSVGELSADKHTGKLIEQLKIMQPNLHVWGLGSSNMRANGAEILFDCQDFSSIGILGVLKLDSSCNQTKKDFVSGDRKNASQQLYYWSTLVVLILVFSSGN